jgi:hypothetical protein
MAGFWNKGQGFVVLMNETRPRAAREPCSTRNRAAL